MKTDLSLYIHIPFCIRKCRYCDFLSFPADEETKEKYVSMLIDEMVDRAQDFEGRNVITVYIGGGTPSTLSGGCIARIMEMVYKAFDVAKDAEITIEINPGTVDEDKLREYREAGINRLSIGLQSTHDRELELLGRIHTYAEFEKTFEMARGLGFENINVDLISALPFQSVDDYRESLIRITKLRPEHISAYSLQLEEDTYLYEHQDEYSFPTEEEDREMYYLTEEVLEQAGYHRYEISNYSLEGYESRHNSIYWTRGNYLGIGLGAASLIDEVRMANTDSMFVYMKGFDVAESHELTKRDRMEEFMFLGLRLTDGVDPEDFYSQFGERLQTVFAKALSRLEGEKLIVIDKKIKLTKLGLDVSNYVFEQFLLG